MNHVDSSIEINTCNKRSQTGSLPFFQRGVLLCKGKGVTFEINYLEIEKVIGREILDSRGNPTGMIMNSCTSSPDDNA